MGVYQSGASVNIGAEVNSQDIRPNTDYIWEYGFPKLAFVLMSPEALGALVKGWVSLKQKIGPEEEGALFEVTGVKVDTDNRVIWIRGKVSGPSKVLEAGINPLYVVAAIAFILGVIGVGVTLHHVYAVGYADATGNPNVRPDACTVSGISASIQCFVSRTGWIAVGTGIGALAMLIILLAAIGREQR